MEKLNITPVMQQYVETKEKYADCIVLFRMGDFYEMFFDDAVEASKILDIALTSRDKDAPNPIPMAGFPAHAVTNYIKKLLEYNKKIAVCEQVEDPKKTKGLVKREVVQIITPGVQVDSDNLDARIPNNLVAVYSEEGRFAVAAVDASTGSFSGTLFFNEIDFINAVAGYEPKEIIVQKNNKKVISILKRRILGLFINEVEDDFFKCAIEDHVIHFSHLKLRFQDVKYCVSAIMKYLKGTQAGLVRNLKPFEFIPCEDHLVIDQNTVRNLELFQTILGGDRKGSLLHLMDMTLTPMGARIFRDRLRNPLFSIKQINNRHDTVQFFYERSILRQALRSVLKGMHDLERIMGKITAGMCNARDLAALADSLKCAGNLKDILQNYFKEEVLIGEDTELGSKSADDTMIKTIFNNLNPLNELAHTLTSTFVDSPPVSTKEGGMIRKGVDAELDKFADAAHQGKEWFLKYEEKERNRTGISNLKVKYNKVFGYIIEVTRSYLNKVPVDYIRKQTVSNAERYYTAELKEYEDLVLNAEDRMSKREQEIFESIRLMFLKETALIHRTAGAIAELDFFLSLSELAVTKRYSRPKIMEEDVLMMEDSRHPVIEEMLGAGRFIPNNILLDGENVSMIIITGPNMAGKSTVIRQAALLVIMAQMGSFVPAFKAVIGVVDRIFTRIGAVDDLTSGRSTFMVEMNETADILKYASSRSLILLDEIGRGTSTYDGISIAWSVAEYIHHNIGARTLFATHYHELTEITKTLLKAKNYSMAVKEWNEDVIFLRKLKQGPASRSYGIQVGKLAGLPENVIVRAKDILKNLEKGEANSMVGQLANTGKKANNSRQISLFENEPSVKADHIKYSEVIEALSKLEIDILSPIEALNLVADWKKKVIT